MWRHVATWSLVAQALGASAGCKSRESADSTRLVVEARLDASMCDRIGRNELFAKYFAADLPQSVRATKITPDAMECELRFGRLDVFGGGDTGAARLSVVCGQRVADAHAREGAKLQYQEIGREVAGIGALALAFGQTELRFWDDDSQCTASIYWPAGASRLESLARELAAALGPTVATSK